MHLIAGAGLPSGNERQEQYGHDAQQYGRDREHDENNEQRRLLPRLPSAV
jgi:hypothetical protein